VRGGIDGSFWLQVIISLGLLLFATLYLLPKVSRWFFRNIEGQASSHYIFVLAMVFISGFFSELAGVEPIIGAFLAGLGLNKVIPHTGILMNRIIFIGNTLFIPFFLISAGMLVDLRLFFNGTSALVFAGVLALVGLVTKYMAAWTTSAIYRYTKYERNILFGLSVSHAAATLAIIKAGFDLKLFDQNVINGTILLILISCLVSSFVSERAARNIAIQEKELVRKSSDKLERILIPVSNPDNIQRLIDLALLIKDQKSLEPIYPLSIVEDDADADEKINVVRKVVEGVAEQIASGDKKVEVLKKVDLSIVDGIVRTAKAYNISDILITYKSTQSTGNLIFGGVADNLLAKSKQSVIVSKILQPLSTFERVLVVLSPNAELENGFMRACSKLHVILKQLGSSSSVYGTENTIHEFSQAVGDRRRAFYRYEVIESFENLPIIDSIKKDDLVLVLNARKQTLSYNYHVDDLPRRIQKQSEFCSFIVFYPELSKALQEGRISDITSPMLAQRYARVRQMTGKITGLFRKEGEEE
jgi:nucleotide-binding universal stress UspA family protein